MLRREQLKRLGRCQDNRFSKQTQFFFHFLTVGVPRCIQKKLGLRGKRLICACPHKKDDIYQHLLYRHNITFKIHCQICFLWDHKCEISAANGEITPIWMHWSIMTNMWSVFYLCVITFLYGLSVFKILKFWATTLWKIRSHHNVNYGICVYKFLVF